MYSSYNRYKSRSSSPSKKAIIVSLIILVSVIYSTKSFFFDDIANASAGDLSKDQVEKIVKEVIKNNPELIIESLKSAQEKEMKEFQEKSKLAAQSKRGELEDTKHTPFEGPNNADITIVEFFDFRCGYCHVAHKTLKQLLTIDKNVKVIYKSFPILGEDSDFAARSALAIYEMEPKKYHIFHDKLMEAKPINKESIHKIIAELGIDQQLFDNAVNKDSIKESLAKTGTLAREIQINGTPAFIINGQVISGGALDVESLKATIAEIRKNNLKQK